MLPDFRSVNVPDMWFGEPLLRARVARNCAP